MNIETDNNDAIEPDRNPDHGRSHDHANSRRVPLIAALMSAALPGFGQLYNGQINRAIWIFLIFFLVSIPLVALIALYLPVALTVGVLFCGLLLALGVWIWGVIDAWRVANKSSDYLLKPWQTSGLYVSVFLLCVMLVLPMAISYVRNHQVKPFRIPSSSMVPTVQPGDFIFTNMNYNCPGCMESIERGDIAVFVYPNNRNWNYIKRIIGMPGDSVVSSNGVVSVNGSALGQWDGSSSTMTEKYKDRSWTVNAGGTLEDFSVDVEPGYVFVLGDNRAASNDSRVFGQVPLADVVGRARQVWFSVNSDGVQWSRLGQGLIPAAAE